MKSESNTERWKDIAGYVGEYQISTYGRVRTVAHVTMRKHKSGHEYPYTVREKIRKTKRNNKGYEQIGLRSYGRPDAYFLIHRLVAEAFLPNPDALPCVNHKNENRSDNRLDNLEWCSYEYNINYGTHKEKAAAWMRERRVRKEVVQMTLDGKEIARFPSQTEASKATGISLSGIRDACTGKYKQMKGYRWRYV